MKLLKLEAFKGYPYMLNLIFVLPLALSLIWTAVELDGALAAYKYNLLNPDFTKVMSFITDYFTKFFYVFYLLMFFYGLKTKKILFMEFSLRYLCLQLLASVLVVQILKFAIGAPRPLYVAEGFVHFSTYGKNHSFPSGHTADILSATLPLALCSWYYFKNKFAKFCVYIVAMLMATLVGFSRVWLFQHHERDVIGSIILISFMTVVVFGPFIKRIKIDYDNEKMR